MYLLTLLQNTLNTAIPSQYVSTWPFLCSKPSNGSPFLSETRVCTMVWWAKPFMIRALYFYLHGVLQTSRASLQFPKPSNRFLFPNAFALASLSAWKFSQISPFHRGDYLKLQFLPPARDCRYHSPSFIFLTGIYHHLTNYRNSPITSGLFDS